MVLDVRSAITIRQGSIQDRVTIVDHSLVAHHLKALEKTVVKTALHAAVAHSGCSDISQFCNNLLEILRKGKLLFYCDACEREKVLDPWHLVMQTAKVKRDPGFGTSLPRALVRSLKDYLKNSESANALMMLSTKSKYAWLDMILECQTDTSVLNAFQDVVCRHTDADTWSDKDIF